MRMGWMCVPVVLSFVACAPAPAPEPAKPAKPPKAEWDDGAAREARAVVDEMVRVFTSMDLEGLKGVIAEDGFIACFELDLDGKPVRMGSRDEAVKYGQDMFEQVGKMGAKLKVDIHAADCRATSTLGTCGMEYDFSATMPDGTTMTQPSRTTFVMRKGDDGWKVTHWHTSLSQAPAPAVPAPPESAPPTETGH